jgi:hypothetical protein
MEEMETILSMEGKVMILLMEEMEMTRYKEMMEMILSMEEKVIILLMEEMEMIL